VDVAFIWLCAGLTCCNVFAPSLDGAKSVC
jgi:hypothetical protein